MHSRCNKQHEMSMHMMLCSSFSASNTRGVTVVTHHMCGQHARPASSVSASTTSTSTTSTASTRRFPSRSWWAWCTFSIWFLCLVVMAITCGWLMWTYKWKLVVSVGGIQLVIGVLSYSPLGRGFLWSGAKLAVRAGLPHGELKLLPICA
jgi:hypothetical protein